MLTTPANNQEYTSNQKGEENRKTHASSSIQPAPRIARAIGFPFPIRFLQSALEHVEKELERSNKNYY